MLVNAEVTSYLMLGPLTYGVDDEGDVIVDVLGVWVLTVGL